MQFSGALKRNRIIMEKLFSFYAILGFQCALGNVTPRINEKALY